MLKRTSHLIAFVLIPGLILDPAVGAAFASPFPSYSITQPLAPSLYQAQALNAAGVFVRRAIGVFPRARKESSRFALSLGRSRENSKNTYRVAAGRLQRTLAPLGLRAPKWLTALYAAVVVAPGKQEENEIQISGFTDRAHTHRTPEQRERRLRTERATQRARRLPWIGRWAARLTHGALNLWDLPAGAPSTSNRFTWVYDEKSPAALRLGPAINAFASGKTGTDRARFDIENLVPTEGDLADLISVICFDPFESREIKFDRDGKKMDYIERWSNVHMAIGLLLKMGPAARPAIPYLIYAATQRRIDARYFDPFLERIGPPLPEDLPALVAFLNESYGRGLTEDVYGAVLKSIAAMKGEGAGARNALERSQAQNWGLEKEFSKTLTAIGKPTAAQLEAYNNSAKDPRLPLAELRSKDAHSIVNAVIRLGERGRESRYAAVEILEALHAAKRLEWGHLAVGNRSHEIYAAINRIGPLTPDQRNIFVAIMAKRDDINAKVWLELRNIDEAPVRDLFDMVSSDSPQRHSLAGQIKNRSYSEADLNEVMELLRENRGKGYPYREALYFVSLLGAQARPLIPRLIDELDPSFDWKSDLNRAIWKTLSGLGGVRPEDEAALASRLTGEEPRVRVLARLETLVSTGERGKVYLPNVLAMLHDARLQPLWSRVDEILDTWKHEGARPNVALARLPDATPEGHTLHEDARTAVQGWVDRIESVIARVTPGGAADVTLKDLRNDIKDLHRRLQAIDEIKDRPVAARQRFDALKRHLESYGVYYIHRMQFALNVNGPQPAPFRKDDEDFHRRILHLHEFPSTFKEVYDAYSRTPYAEAQTPRSYGHVRVELVGYKPAPLPSILTTSAAKDYFVNLLDLREAHYRKLLNLPNDPQSREGVEAAYAKAMDRLENGDGLVNGGIWVNYEGADHYGAQNPAMLLESARKYFLKQVDLNIANIGPDAEDHGALNDALERAFTAGHATQQKPLGGVTPFRIKGVSLLGKQTGHAGMVRNAVYVAEGASEDVLLHEVIELKLWQWFALRLSGRDTEADWSTLTEADRKALNAMLRRYIAGLSTKQREELKQRMHDEANRLLPGIKALAEVPRVLAPLNDAFAAAHENAPDRSLDLRQVVTAKFMALFQNVLLDELQRKDLNRQWTIYHGWGPTGGTEAQLKELDAALDVLANPKSLETSVNRRRFQPAKNEIFGQMLNFDRRLWDVLRQRYLPLLLRRLKAEQAGQLRHTIQVAISGFSKGEPIARAYYEIYSALKDMGEDVDRWDIVIHASTRHKIWRQLAAEKIAGQERLGVTLELYMQARKDLPPGQSEEYLDTLDLQPYEGALRHSNAIIQVLNERLVQFRKDTFLTDEPSEMSSQFDHFGKVDFVLINPEETSFNPRGLEKLLRAHPSALVAIGVQDPKRKFDRTGLTAITSTHAFSLKEISDEKMAAQDWELGFPFGYDVYGIWTPADLRVPSASDSERSEQERILAFLVTLRNDESVTVNSAGDRYEIVPKKMAIELIHHRLVVAALVDPKRPIGLSNIDLRYGRPKIAEDDSSFQNPGSVFKFKNQKVQSFYDRWVAIFLELGFALAGAWGMVHLAESHGNSWTATAVALAGPVGFAILWTLHRLFHPEVLKGQGSRGVYTMMIDAMLVSAAFAETLAAPDATPARWILAALTAVLAGRQLIMHANLNWKGFYSGDPLSMRPPHFKALFTERSS